MKTTIKNSSLFGIDLGTTNTVITCWDESGRAKVLPNLDGDLKTPSIVYAGPNAKEILVGQTARSMGVLEPERVIRECKRDVGTDRVYLEERNLQITAEWCQAQILKYAAESVRHYFHLEQDESLRAVISVPAYFREPERQSVQRSALAAGIELIQLINEPTAAGLAHGLADNGRERKTLVVDFGGGTTDVSLIQYAGGEATVLSTCGDRELGGKEVDALLYDQVKNAFEQEHDIDLGAIDCPEDVFTIQEEVIRQKTLLSCREEVRIIARAGGACIQLAVDRRQLSNWCADLQNRIRELIERTLSDAGIDIDEVDEVLPVGGSSRLVWFRALLEELFGSERLISGSISPDFAIAEGAVILAVRAVQESGTRVVDTVTHEALPQPAISHSDVMPHSLGISIQQRAEDREVCSVLLQRNTPLPCQSTRLYGSVNEQQTRFLVRVLQGEEGMPLEECLIVGERELELPARSSARPSIEATMGYNTSGMVQVFVKDRVSGREEDITVDFSRKLLVQTGRESS